MPLDLTSTAKIRGANEIPVLGFGTYEMDSKEAYQAVIWALEAGYRHVDTAEWYENESAVGHAVLDFCSSHSIPRSDIFYTTKLRLNNGYTNVRKSIEKSLKKSGLGYIDLYLIHGPLGGKQMRQESWRACVDAQKEGKLKNIGISTFSVGHMNDILEMGIGVPAVHQIDLHPFMTRAEIVKLSREHDILLEAWGPLVRGIRFDHFVIVGLGRKYNKEPAQILIRYSLQKGYVPLPKSSNYERIVSNTKVFDFELTDDEMDLLDSLDEYLVTDWDPTVCE